MLDYLIYGSSSGIACTWEGVLYVTKILKVSYIIFKEDSLIVIRWRLWPILQTYIFIL